MMRAVVPAAFLLACMGAVAQAQEWAREMFEVGSHDFGTIARGSKAEYEFVFTNKYLAEVHVAAAQSSCGCTSVSIKQPSLETYERGSIVARINSGSFLGRQKATITVRFDRPQPAEVQLQVKVFVRGDLVLEPACISLGNIDHRSPAEGQLSVTHYGRNDWKIVDVKSENPRLTVEAIETLRSANRVAYTLRARLSKDAPPGHVREHLLLITNDAGQSQIPVLVQGRVMSAVTVSPATLFLGVIPPGGTVTKQIVVRAKTPFRILAVKPECACLKIEVPREDGPKKIHLIPVTFVAADQPGKVSKTIRIETDLDQAVAELTAYAAVSKLQEP